MTNGLRKEELKYTKTIYIYKVDFFSILLTCGREVWWHVSTFFFYTLGPSSFRLLQFNPTFSWRKGRRNKINKPWNRIRAMKESINVRSPKIRSWKPRRAWIIDGKPTTGRQHQRRLKFVPTQRDAAPNICQNLRKKRSANIDWNNLQRVRNNRTNENS